MKNNRIYYRNPFFHLGHLQTLFHNDEFATVNKGKCYMLLDDRYVDYCSSLEEDIAYLSLKSTVIISIRKYTNIINAETKKLVTAGKIYMLAGKNNVINAAQISAYIDTCSTYFQLKLTGSDTIVGFVKQNEHGQLKLIYMFEYIVKICDMIFNITDVTNDLPETFKILNTRTLNLLPIKEYIIEDFKYTKKLWPTEMRTDPCLLTLKGLKKRGVPSCVLWDFYRYGVKHERVTLFDFEKILIAHLHTVAEGLTIIIDPLLLTLSENDAIYINRADFGLDQQHLRKNRSCNLFGQSGGVKCTDIEMTKTGIQALKGERVHCTSDMVPTLPWLAADDAIKTGRLRIYNWFYTGLNDIISPTIAPIIYNGRVVPEKIYSIKDWGFISYRGEKEFISICKV